MEQAPRAVPVKAVHAMIERLDAGVAVEDVREPLLVGQLGWISVWKLGRRPPWHMKIGEEVIVLHQALNDLPEEASNPAVRAIPERFKIVDNSHLSFSSLLLGRCPKSAFHNAVRFI